MANVNGKGSPKCSACQNPPLIHGKKTKKKTLKNGKNDQKSLSAKKAMENLRHTGRNSSEKNLSYAAARTKRRK